ncbi:MAG: DNA translocase FtsK 4TM domain-containing protein [Planctomycetaceae bacterium]|nr:DNA translocase FtsK 4TM domain-containing protein [Planctomycetales bacterium]MCB9923864.1 DNA translocase FtsK 4TM domain-containing protein [Planctomycetaceae bacterium]
MFENRSLRLDLFALALCGFVIFLGASLGTYSPADTVPQLMPPFDRFYHADQLVYPATTTLTNACGKWGALASDIMLNGLGIGAYYVILSLVIVDVLLLSRRSIDTPALRSIGWVLSLAGLTSIISLIAPNASLGPMIGAGGYLGVLGRTLLETHFALAGSLILASSLLIGGLMLCTDYALFRMAFTAGAFTATGVAKGRQRIAERRQVLAERKPAKSEKSKPVKINDDLEDVEEEIEELAVKVRGKTVEEDVEEFPVVEDIQEELIDEEPDQDVIQPEPEVVVKKKERPKKPSGVTSRPHFSMKNGFDKEAREQVMTTLDAAANQEDSGEYELPDIDLLIEGDDVCLDEQVKEVRRKAKILEKTFADFGFNVKVVEIETGPVIAQYEVELEAGLRLAKITNLADDLAIALRVPSVRIVAPIPGKNTVGIEVPNEMRQVVRLREVIEETNGKTKKMKIPLFLGKDVSGNPLTVDLATLPHLLIAGRTGTGKSVCLNAIISSILMTKRPDEVRMLMIDPKMVELSGYGRLPHLMHPVVTDMRKAEAILAWAVDKMEERYAMLARAGVRHVSSYNQLSEEELRRRMDPETEEEWAAIPTHLPFIVIVADEMADLMMTAGKEVEQHIIRLAQKSRAVGIHLILATQKPTVDVITGLIKSNLPARISFQVASRTDSRVVLDEMGADKLLGNGDMLFLWPGTSSLLRGQGTYLSDEEIESVVDCVSTGEQHFVNELVNLKVDEGDGETPGPLKKRDDLYEAAVDVVVREGRGSVSLLQRTLGIGYGRAARLIDYMAEDGIVGAYAGSQAREVIISLSDWEAMQSGGEAASEPPTTPVKAVVEPKRRSNKIKPAPDWDDDDEEAAAQEEWNDGFGEDEEEEDWDEEEQEEYEAESA